MKRIFTLLLAVAVCAACSDDDPQGPVICPEYHLPTLSFEASEGWKDLAGGAVVPGDITMSGAAVSDVYHDVFWFKSVAGYEEYLSGGNYNGMLATSADGDVRIGTSFSSSDYGEFWGGFVFSSSFGTSAAEFSYSDQFTVRAERGAGDSETCLVGYCDDYSGGYALPTIEFARAHTVCHCYLANTELTYTYVPMNVEPAAYRYRVIVTGYLGDTETGRVATTLIDGAQRLSGWQFVDLSGLGRVDRLVFTTETNDCNAYGPVAPAYFAVDEIGFIAD